MQIRFGAMSPKLHEQLGLSEEEYIRVSNKVSVWGEKWENQ